MADDLMQYDVMVEDALRGVVRAALAKVAEDGLPGAHHFYIGFRTTADDVEIPDYLRQNFPDEMTIVLQNQFWGLELLDGAFEVTLSFNKRQERLHIPFAALTSFFDPSVQFGLQFERQKGALVPINVEPDQPAPTESGAEAGSEEKVDTGQDGTGDDKVVTLDAFRKK